MARVEQRAHRDQDPGRVFGGDGVEHGGPQVERRAPEQVGDRAGVEAVGAVGERLVEQRQRIARRAGGGAGDHRQRLGVGVDALLPEDVRQEGLELVPPKHRVCSPPCDEEQCRRCAISVHNRSSRFHDVGVAAQECAAEFGDQFLFAVGIGVKPVPLGDARAVQPLLVAG